MKITRKIASALLLMALSGCSYNLALMSRNSSEMGHGKANKTDQSVVIEISGKTYTGKYVFIEGGSFSLGALQGYAGAKQFGGTNAVTAVSAVGNGNVLARSNDGHGLRCVFNFSSWSQNGAGICQSDDGKLYDLQIEKG